MNDLIILINEPKSLSHFNGTTTFIQLSLTRKTNLIQDKGWDEGVGFNSVKYFHVHFSRQPC